MQQEIYRHFFVDFSIGTYSITFNAFYVYGLVRHTIRWTEWQINGRLWYASMANGTNASFVERIFCLRFCMR